jgi:quercetin dioxygenase-like cupin family protein
MLSQEKAKPHQHAGVELLYVIHGKLEMVIGAEAHTLNAGDSIYFDSSQRHTYRRLGKHPCSAVIVTT